jgi:hypothetical protein
VPGCVPAREDSGRMMSQRSTARQIPRRTKLFSSARPRRRPAGRDRATDRQPDELRRRADLPAFVGTNSPAGIFLRSCKRATACPFILYESANSGFLRACSTA